MALSRDFGPISAFSEKLIEASNHKAQKSRAELVPQTNKPEFSRVIEEMLADYSDRFPRSLYLQAGESVRPTSSTDIITGLYCTVCTVHGLTKYSLRPSSGRFIIAKKTNFHRPREPTDVALMWH